MNDRRAARLKVPPGLGSPGLGPLDPPLEKHEQQGVVALLRLAGFAVRNTSQVRPSMVALGIPDLIVHHVGLKRGGWFECKRKQRAGYDPGDRATWLPEPLRPEQFAFRMDAVQCGQLFGWGTFQDCERWLVDLGLGTMDAGGVLTLRPRHYERIGTEASRTRHFGSSGLT